MGRTGEAVRRVTREGFNPAWSPDGQQLVYAGRAESASPAVGSLRLHKEGQAALLRAAFEDEA